MISTAPLASTRTSLARHWWIPLVRGIVAVLFGIAVVVFPVAAIGTFVIFFGAFAFVDGVLAVVQALRFAHASERRWWLQLVSGIAGILIGVLTIAWPAITALVLAIFIAAWAFVTGILEIGAGVRIRKNVPGEIFAILAGALSIVLGIVLFFYPLTALVAGAWIVGLYAIMAGFALIALAFRLRAHRA